MAGLRALRIESALRRTQGGEAPRRSAARGQTQRHRRGGTQAQGPRSRRRADTSPEPASKRSPGRAARGHSVRGTATGVENPPSPRPLRPGVFRVSLGRLWAGPGGGRASKAGAADRGMTVRAAGASGQKGPEAGGERRSGPDSRTPEGPPPPKGRGSQIVPGKPEGQGVRVSTPDVVPFLPPSDPSSSRGLAWIVCLPPGEGSLGLEPPVPSPTQLFALFR